MLYKLLTLAHISTVEKAEMIKVITKQHVDTFMISAVYSMCATMQDRR